jgi:hypothetical protein
LQRWLACRNVEQAAALGGRLVGDKVTKPGDLVAYVDQKECDHAGLHRRARWQSQSCD